MNRVIRELDSVLLVNELEFEFSVHSVNEPSRVRLVRQKLGQLKRLV